MSENDDFDFSDMIFDIGCGKCGEVIFSLPYKLDMVHSMKCHGCGETNIIEVDEKGGIGHILKFELSEIINNFRKELGNRIFICNGHSSSYDSCNNKGTINDGIFNLLKFESNGFKVNYRVVCSSNKYTCSKNKYDVVETINLKSYVTKD